MSMIGGTLPQHTVADDIHQEHRNRAPISDTTEYKTNETIP